MSMEKLFYCTNLTWFTNFILNLIHTEMFAEEGEEKYTAERREKYTWREDFLSDKKEHML